MKLFAGIDGGQSSTVAVIGDENGRVLGRGVAGAADEIGAGRESTRLADALHDSLERAGRSANLAPVRRFEAIVAGISGYDGRVYGRAPDLPSARMLLLHDTPIAHAGALGGAAGVVVIAGTGSVVYGRDDSGHSCTLGGWGFLFGDEGSAFAIVRDALAMLMRARDEGDSSLDLPAREACGFFGASSLRVLAHAFYKGGITRDRLASFASTALGLEVFRPIADAGADRLAALACVAIARVAAARVALVGGVFSNAYFRERVAAGIRRERNGAQIVDARYEPAYGALLLAYREGGSAVTELQQ
ncbi:MAG: hypothetical protein JOZ77_05755 [Candidatus Eremiobacteraeota bacterium]|nr:hypothetical protein [Candidatus Eremiobacteraeota bacterium]